MFEPKDPEYETKVRESFAAQKVMPFIGARLDRVEPGFVTIDLPFKVELTQQREFLHAGIVTTIVDSACGYAAFSLMDAESEVLSVEFKVNLLSPAVGERFVATGEVVKPGRTLTVCNGRLHAFTGGDSKLVAQMVATMIAVRR